MKKNLPVRESRAVKQLDAYQEKAEHLLLELGLQAQLRASLSAKRQPVLFSKAKYRFMKFLGLRRKENLKSEGVYLHGGVGRGKTMLMDAFFENICDKVAIKRFHYHDFMRLIHEALYQQRQETDATQDILIAQTVTKVIGEACTALCLDEMEVIDITDAMLMLRLFRELCNRGLIFVFTSNLAPDDLYKDGLQRELFLPFIAMLKETTVIYSLGNICDYRERNEKKTAWFSGKEDKTQEELHHLFESWQVNTAMKSGDIEIALGTHKRVIHAKYRQYDKVWFDFSCLCDAPLSSKDFIKLAHKFRYMAIEGVPKLADLQIDALRRFVVLIDILYDEKVQIGISSLPICEEANLGDYFSRKDGDRYGVPRLISRLQEML